MLINIGITCNMIKTSMPLDNMYSLNWNQKEIYRSILIKKEDS